MLSRFNTAAERDRRTERRTDGQTELLYQYREAAVMCRRAIKTPLHCTVQ